MDPPNSSPVLPPRGGPRRGRVALGVWLRWLWLGCLPCLWAGERPSEYQVKAALVFHFVKFTSWPASPPAQTNEPITIGIVGDDPFAGALDTLIRGETVRGRPLRLLHFKEGSPPEACQLLFLSRSAVDRRDSLLTSLRTQPTLTMADHDGFCEAGGMVNLYLTPERMVRPEINLAAVRGARLEISSRVLGLPTVRLVEPRPTPDRP